MQGLKNFPRMFKKFPDFSVGIYQNQNVCNITLNYENSL